MKKRRVLSLFSILLVSLLFSPYTFSQETPGPVVRVAPRPLLSDNDPHRVDIVIENGQAVTGYQVMLQYDHDYIEYVDIDHGNYLPDDAFFGDAQIRDTDPNDSFKAILFAAAAFPNQSEGDGVLATLTFKTIIAESSDLTLLDVTLLSHDVVDNTVAVSSPQLENSRTYVVEPPDLVVQSFGASLTGDKSDSLTEITLYPNGEFYLHVGIKNDETETSDQTRVLYYQSDDDTISGDDTLILGGKKVSLSGNSVRARYLKRQAPDISGTYFYYACVESVPHETKTGNNCSSNVVKITVSSICTFPETVAGDERKVGRVAYSPDGTVLAAGDRDDNFHFHFWNASTGEHLHTGEAKGRIYGMAFSPGGKWFAIGTDGGELWLWERNQSTDSTWLEMLQDNSSLPSAPTITVPRPGLIGAGNLNDITSVAFSHDGNRLAIGTGRDDVFVSEYNAGTWDDWDDNTVLVPKQESIVRSVAFHPTDSNIFVSGYEDGRVRIWDLSGGLSNYKNNGPDPQVLSGDAPVYSIAFSPNGDYLATAGMFKKPSGSGHPSGGSINTWHKIALWKRQNNQWVNHTYFFTDDQHDTDVLSVAFHPSGNVLLSGDKNGNIHAWGVRLGNHLGRINDYNFSNSNISSIAFNSQGNAGAVGMDRGEVHQFTFDVSNQTLTQANVTINDRPKVHVIWYHASNEKLRGTSRSFALPDYPDYIQPNNVEQNLKDVQDFFLRELGTTFEFELDNNGIKVEYIQSRNFFASDVKGGSEDNLNNSYTPNSAHFKDNADSADVFFEDVWSDITTNHPNSVSSYNTSNDIYLVLVQSNHGYLGETTDLGEKISGTVGRVDKIGGRIAMVALGDFHKEWNNETIKITIAHELGHNFGLFHDFAEEGPIMSYNPEEAGSWSLIVLSGRHDRLDSNWLSERSKNWLKVHPVFNKCTFSPAADNPINIGVRDASQAAHTLTPLSAGFPIPSITVSPNSNNEYKIHLDIEDLDGLHHVELIAPSLKSYTGCAGECGSKNSVAEWWSSNKPRTSWSREFDITEWMTQYPGPKGFYTKIAAIDDGGNILYFDLHIVPGASVAPAPLAEKHLPKETALLVNYPNPFNPETWIPYQLATPADVSLTIYDIQGGVVRDLDFGHQRAGMYQSRARAAYWDGRNAVGEPVASGVYFYTLKAGEFTATRKMLIRK